MAANASLNNKVLKIVLNFTFLNLCRLVQKMSRRLEVYVLLSASDWYPILRQISSRNLKETLLAIRAVLKLSPVSDFVVFLYITCAELRTFTFVSLFFVFVVLFVIISSFKLFSF